MNIKTRQEDIPAITIDGPSGTGKGTLSQLLAGALGWNFLDSGALYRVLAFAAKQHAVALNNASALTVLAAHLDVQFKAIETGKPSRIIFEGSDITDELRSESCGNDASRVAAIPEVRVALIDRQRAFLEPPGLVTDGRDMGTVIFPNATLKLYLDASLEVRAKRRYNQLKEKGIAVKLEQIYNDLEQRDKRDKHRSVAPLKPAADAIIIDTTQLSIDQVLQTVLRIARDRLAAACT